MIDENTLFVYINLDSRVDKMEYMESILSSMNLNYVRFSAIKPTIDSLIEGEYNSFYDRSIDWMKYHLNGQDSTKTKLAIGTFGCYLSHYFILRKYAFRYKSIFILEDDVKFVLPSLNKFIKCTNSLVDNKNDVDVVRPCRYMDKFDCLAYVNKNISKFDCCFHKSIYSNDNKTHSKFGCTHFVYYHNIINVLKYIECDYVFNIDALLSTNVINSYLLQTTIYQNRSQFDSDIGSFNDLN